jgi:hypothetical protein
MKVRELNTGRLIVSPNAKSLDGNVTTIVEGKVYVASDYYYS